MDEGREKIGNLIRYMCIINPHPYHNYIGKGKAILYACWQKKSRTCVFDMNSRDCVLDLEASQFSNKFNLHGEIAGRKHNVTQFIDSLKVSPSFL